MKGFSVTRLLAGEKINRETGKNAQIYSMVCLVSMSTPAWSYEDRLLFRPDCKVIVNISTMYISRKIMQIGILIKSC